MTLMIFLAVDVPVVSGAQNAKPGSVAGPTMASTSTAKKLIAPPTQGDLLADALDTFTLAWKTGGSASWFGFTGFPFVGIYPERGSQDAATSGLISHNQESWVETDVTTPGTLVFLWAVSSQPNQDKLSLIVGGAPVASISGALGWTREVVQVPAGTLRWSYSKDGTGTQGYDRGYLDQIEFYPSKAVAPEIFIAPVNTTVDVGLDTVLMVGVRGEAPFAYQWYKNGVPLEGATQSKLTVREATLGDAGLYHVMVSNRLGSVTSVPVTLKVSTYWFELALDNSPGPGEPVWATGGDKSWLAFTNDPTAHDGRDMARSGMIGDNQESWVERTLIGPGIVSFWWKVSSESEADFLRFQIGNVELAKISGEVNWRVESFEIPAGVQRLRWRYTKNGAGSEGQDRGWLDQFIVLPTPQQSIAFALDATNLVWKTGGNVGWVDFTRWTAADIPPLDNRGAASSGPITHGQRSWLETELPGPGTLAFWWAVSSQTNADSVRFSIDGIEMASISGNTNWHVEVFPIPAGLHTVRWEYSKDGSVSQGLDRALLDRVAFAPTGGKVVPVVVQSALSQTAIEAYDASLLVIAAGVGPLSYQWFKDSLPIPGATNSILNLHDVTLSDAGFYHAAVSNAAGAVQSDPAYLTVARAPLAVVLEATSLRWTTGGNASWFPYNSFAGAYGFNAAGSGFINDNQKSWIETQVTGPAVVQFKWRVSSEANADFLRFYLGSVELAKISGEVDWRQESFPLPAGQQVLRWEYTTDKGGKGGRDQGWLDQVIISSGPPMIVQPPQNESVVAGDSVVFTVSAEGLAPLRYQWLKNGIDIPGATNFTLSLGSAQTADTNQYSVRVSNALGSVSTRSVMWGFTSAISLAGALDTPNLTWTTGDIWLWSGFTRATSPVANDGFDAARTGGVSNPLLSWIQTRVTGPATVRFWWKLSAGGNMDSLRIFVGGAEVGRITGETGWRQETITIADGEQELRWDFLKGLGVGWAWLDRVEVSPLPKLVIPPQSRTVSEGGTVTFNVVPIWNGWLAYQWLKDGKIIAGETNDFLRLSAVSLRDVGNYSMMVTSELGSFTTAPAELIVQPLPDRFLQMIAGTPTAAFLMKTTSGRRYVLESKDSWNSTQWEAVETFLGDGTTQTFKDPRPTARSRFYRVRLE